MPSATAWIDLEIVIQNEENRCRKTNMISLIYGINLKKGANELIYKTEVE